jgi:Tfp pilus assembly protein PilE
MGGIINKKLKGSTLIEVLIAMVIIMIIFAIAMQVFSNVLNTGVSFKKIQVQNQLQLLAQEVKEKGYLEQNDRQLDSVNYQLTTTLSEVEGVSKLEIRATQQGKNLGNLKCLFQLKEKREEN